MAQQNQKLKGLMSGDKRQSYTCLGTFVLVRMLSIMGGEQWNTLDTRSLKIQARVINWPIS
jgi:hypothetical protein